MSSNIRQSYFTEGSPPQGIAAKPFPHPGLADHIDFQTQQFLKVHEKSAVIQERSIGIESDGGGIEVGGFSRVAACDRTEDSDVEGAVLAAHRRYLLKKYLASILLAYASSGTCINVIKRISAMDNQRSSISLPNS